MDLDATGSSPLLDRDGLAGKWAEQDATGRPRKGGRHNRDKHGTDNIEGSIFGVVLCGVRTPANVGAIMRLCSCFGTADLLHLHYASNDDTNRKYWRQSQISQELESCSVGTKKRFEHEGAPFQSVQVSEFVPYLASDDRPPVIVLEAVAGATSIYDFQFPERCKIMVGSEHKGVSKEILRGLRKGLDAVIFVPMTGPHHSMNVASVMSVALYEYRRQWRGISD
mmetsp:Transcript_28142/g.39587  ORF Transcript_28142/g.39587 Transcript_28142/m.39587 type:complete len:224 (+) Transcript_28142:27-698(+)